MTDKKNEEIHLEIVDTGVPMQADGLVVAGEPVSDPEPPESQEAPVEAAPAEPAAPAEQPKRPKRAARKATPADETVQEGLALEQAIADQAREDEREGSFNQSLKRILVGELLNSKILRENVGLMILIIVFVVISITNRYTVQQKLLEQSKLKKELQDTKFRAFSAASELTERTRKSRIMEALRARQDSLLKEPAHPAFLIEVNRDK